jgi:hypothetical protein
MHHELENLLGTQENKSDITTVPQEEKHRLRLSLDENSEDYDALGIGNVSLAAGVGVGETRLEFQYIRGLMSASSRPSCDAEPDLVLKINT